MKLSDRAKSQAQALGIKGLKAKAEAAFKTSTGNVESLGKLGMYLLSIVRQYNGTAVKLEGNIVYVFTGDTLAALYALPHQLTTKKVQ